MQDDPSPVCQQWRYSSLALSLWIVLLMMILLLSTLLLYLQCVSSGDTAFLCNPIEWWHQLWRYCSHLLSHGIVLSRSQWQGDSFPDNKPNLHIERELMSSPPAGGAHLTNILWSHKPNLVKINNYPIWNINSWPSYNLAHAMTAVLSWHVQNCNLVRSLNQTLTYFFFFYIISIMSS